MSRVAFYQFNPVFGDVEGNLEKVFSAIENADTDLLVLPEFFATGYQFVEHDEVDELSETIPDGRTTQRLIAVAREKEMFIVAGLPERSGDRFYNSAVLVGPEGLIGFYRKTHLFGEEKLFFEPGDTGFRVWDTPIGRIGIMICFDWFFPEAMRVLSLLGAEMIAHPANLVLPYCPRSMPTRCLENRVFAVTANRTGIEERRAGTSLRFIGQSRIISPEGTVLASAEADEEIVAVAAVDMAQARNKTLNPFNDLFSDRRPSFYRVIALDAP